MHIYLSPHHDDVYFSIGHLASRQGGEIVNIFTRSDYVEGIMALPAAPAERVETVSALRLREDLAFVQAACLARHDLGLEEPALTGFGPFDLAGLPAAVTRTANRLIPFLLDLLPPAGDPRAVELYCPAGIGGHRDHVSTLLAVREAYEKLRGRCTLHLYEDLHYASVPQARAAGLERAAKVFSRMELSPTVHVMSEKEAARKMQLVGLYASQHAAPPQPEKFIPASNLVKSMHEIVWNVEN
jgi:hypothetical protein